jgi:ferric-dicitrate binding protein FerR (iron transport regulator)
MPLSEHEQRLLDQIERALIAEDPKFASTVRAGRLRRPTRRRRLQGLSLFLLGLVLLVVGVAVRSIWLSNVPVVSVVGFLVMLAGAVLAVTSIGACKKAPTKGAEPDRNRFGGKMEERFRRRFEQE